MTATPCRKLWCSGRVQVKVAWRLSACDGWPRPCRLNAGITHGTQAGAVHCPLQAFAGEGRYRASW